MYEFPAWPNILGRVGALQYCCRGWDILFRGEKFFVNMQDVSSIMAFVTSR